MVSLFVLFTPVCHVAPLLSALVPLYAARIASTSAATILVNCMICLAPLYRPKTKRTGKAAGEMSKANTTLTTLHQAESLSA